MTTVTAPEKTGEEATIKWLQESITKADAARAPLLRILVDMNQYRILYHGDSAPIPRDEDKGVDEQVTKLLANLESQLAAHRETLDHMTSKP